MPRANIFVKIFVLILTISIFSTFSAAFFGFYHARESLRKEALAHLVSIRDIKKNHIESYLLEKLADTKVLSYNPSFIQHLEKHSQYPSTGDSSRRTEIIEDELFHKKFRAETLPHLVQMKLYDVFLIEKDGTVGHTVKEEDDLGRNLIHGKYKDTYLAEAFSKGLKGTVITDINFYSPSDNRISAFMAAPVKNKNGDVLGVVASQITMEEINKVMHERSGLGETGETFLVGSDLLLRSDSRFFKEPTALKRKVDTEAPRRAISGKTGTMWLLDYRDIPVLNAYTPLNIPGLNWGLIAKIDEDEVFAPIYRLRNQTINGTLVLVLLILIISYLFSKRLVSPITTLDNKLSEMAATGKYGQSMLEESTDEIGSLVKSFNRMSSTIELQTIKLQKSEQKTRGIIQTVGEGIIVIGSDSMIRFVNPELCDIFGYSEEELVGRQIMELMPEKYRELHMAGMNRYLEGGKAKILGYRLELEGLRKFGEVFPIDLKICETRVEKNDDRFFTASIRDITERKQNEQQREELISDLNKINAELKDFAFVVSHDLKAPLRAITSLADWIKKDYAEALDEDGCENLDLLVGRTKRMNNLIGGILKYSRLGQKKVEPEWLNFEKIVHNVINAIAPPDNISVQVEGTLADIQYDRTHLEQLFQNLIYNAIIHMEKPEGEVVVSCRDDNDFFEFCVRDNGVGIEKRHFERIFKMCQSLKPRDEIETSGIGLFLVKKIVEIHNGRVWVESTVGEGSAFYFTIPKAVRGPQPKGLPPDMLTKSS